MEDLKEKIMMKFSKRLKELRNEKNITSKVLAEKIDVTKTTISHYENSKYLPSIETMYLLAEYLDVSIDYLLGRISKRVLFEKKEEK